MTEKEFVQYIGPLARADMQKTGILASVTAAQAILESGYGTTELAKNAHNLFGMKATLSGNNWPSRWSGATYTKKTKEYEGGRWITISAAFRKYGSDAESIADHSAYLSGAKNGAKLRYAGLVGEKDYRKAAALIKAGGYATDPNYVEKLASIIQRYSLTQYDKEEKTMSTINIIKKTGTHGMYNGARNIRYLVIHYTAGVTSKKGAARNTASWFANPKAGGTADFIVDDAEIVQYNPDPATHSCWAVGGGKYNNKGGRLYGTAKNTNCVSIEICSNSKSGKVLGANDPGWYFTDAELDNAAKLAKYLMEKYSIPIDRMIRHYDVNGKPCPGIRGWNEDSGDTSAWLAFRKRLGATGSTTAKPAGGTNSGSSAAAPAGTAVNYKYEVTVSDLNIRKGPGTNYAAVGQTGKGTFTIVVESGGWGKLKSGAGWISLDSRYGHKVSGGTAAAAKPSGEFKWTVTVSDLRIRKTPGGAPTGKYTGKGTFTITEQSGGWGKLKSGAGWISLDTRYGHKA